ncbi:arsenate reductase (thioredoxin) [Companilactobacillus sp. RD055328]|uniref:arsenate reductase (thioredoxin) n=1 Tax=Companilactobacillus sp. RD055328 TaxID=2916634 RepID=UPI001FC7C3EA|nr:arsenate reductase (thioredoxin) [Companilactobacillus sp. RD055328]GKQ42295.1 arsenate reductase (thioredoxin) [Companilactobacillus sp. RD055328]
MKKVYFLCTGNSCRSQMAEGYAKDIWKDEDVEIRSAGVEMHGLNPKAVQVMGEDNIDISMQESTLIDNDYFADADLIITLCGDAKDRCPMIANQAIHEHWDLPDPAQAKGTEEEVLDVFRSVRDDLKNRIINKKEAGI